MADNSTSAALRTEVAQGFSRLKEIIQEAEADMEKFTIKENDAAGTRLRKAMQDTKDVAQQIRIKTQEAKNS